MNKDTDKFEWTEPLLSVLDFKKTSSGPIPGPTEEEGNYSGTQAGS
jgi:hypothetical protein